MSGTRTLSIKQVACDQLSPSAHNPRHMPEAQLEKLKRSITEFGLVEPVVVRKEDNSVVGGHQRLVAAKALGMERVPVVYVHLSEAEAKALSLALNKIQGEWDVPKLGQLLEELQDLPDLDETLSGFDEQEMDRILAELERQAAPPPMEATFGQAAETMQKSMERAPTRVQPGELWLLDRHRLLCGDILELGVLERACDGELVDLVVADGPYGLDYRSTHPRAGRRKRPIANDSEQGFEASLERALPIVKARMKQGAVMYWFGAGGGPSTALAKVLVAVDRHFTLLNTVVWDRVDLGLGTRWRRRWEAIVEASAGRPRVWHGGTDQANVLRFPRAIPPAGSHPTPKPLQLVATLIRAAAPARGRVLDPFLGSGTTLLACQETGRSCCGVEVERKYCDWAIARWEAVTGQSAVRG